MKKLFGLLCIVHWPLINIAMFALNLHAPWYLSGHALIAEFFAGLINLGITLYGFSIFFPKAKLYISIIGALLFTSYQTFAFGWGLDRYRDKLQLKDDSTLLVTYHGGGALSAKQFLQLELYRPAYGVFLEQEAIHQYAGFRDARLAREDDDIVIFLESQENRQFILKESVSDLLDE